MCLILLAIAIIIMFPVWPRPVKIYAFYINLWLLYVLTGIMVIRQVLYVIIRIFGVKFWFFPNFHEDVFLETFWPVYSVEISKDNKFFVIIRIVACGFLGYLAFFLY